MRISDWSSDVCSSDLHQQIVPTGRRDLQGALGGFLPFDLFEIRPRAGHLRLAGLWRGQEAVRSEEHPSELQSLMRISYAVFCLKKKKIYIIVLIQLVHTLFNTLAILTTPNNL